MSTNAQISTPGYFSAKWGSTLFLSITSVFIGVIALWFVFGDFSSSEASSDTSEDTLGMLFATGAMLVTAVQHVSLLMILNALFWSKFRAPWFYSATQVSSVFMFFSVGGPILAIIVSRYLHHHRAEFMLGETKMPPPLPASTGATTSTEQLNGSQTVDGLDIAAMLDENRRLKALVAEQALQLQERNAR